MNEKEIGKENYDYIYEDYLEAEKGDTDDLIFAALLQEKKHSEK